MEKISASTESVPPYLGSDIWPTSYTPDIKENHEKLRANQLKKKDYISWFSLQDTIELNKLTQTFN